MYNQVSYARGRKANLPGYRKRNEKTGGQRKDIVSEDGSTAKPVRPYLLTRFRKRRNDACKAISKEDYRDICKGVKAFAEQNSIKKLRLPRTFGHEFFECVRDIVMSNMEYYYECDLSITEVNGKKCLMFAGRGAGFDSADDYQPLIAGGIWKIPNSRLAEACKNAIRQLSFITPLLRADDCVYSMLADWIIENQEGNELDEIISGAEDVQGFFQVDMKNSEKYKELSPRAYPRKDLEKDLEEIIAEESLTDKERDLASYMLANIDVIYTDIEQMDTDQGYSSVVIAEYDFFPILIDKDPFNLAETSIWMTTGETVGGDMTLIPPFREYVILPDGSPLEIGRMIKFRNLLKNLSEKLSEF